MDSLDAKPVDRKGQPYVGILTHQLTTQKLTQNSELPGHGDDRVSAAGSAAQGGQRALHRTQKAQTIKGNNS